MNIPRDGANIHDCELMMRARTLHSQACASVDAPTLARLTAARRNALATKFTLSHKRIWLPVVGAAAACALTLSLIVWNPGPAPSHANSPQVTQNEAELPPDADAQQIDLYQNLDFYRWLAQQPDLHGAHAGAPQ